MAVKNVIFNVSANTKKAEEALAALIKQLEQIKEASKTSVGVSVANVDAQLNALSKKLDAVAKQNEQRAKNTTKKVEQTEQQQLDASIKAQDKKKKEQDDAWAEYNAQIENNNKKFGDAAQKQVEITKKTEDEKARQMKEGFDARDKEEKNRQAQNKKIVKQEIDDFNNLQRGKKAAQKILDDDVKRVEKEQRQRDAEKRREDAQKRREDREKAAADAKARREQIKAERESQKLQDAIRRRGEAKGKDFGPLGNAINFIAQAVANSSKNFVRLQNVIARTGVALGAISIGAGIATLGRQAINAAKDFEVLKVSFTTLLGNAITAEQKIKELRTFAAETPFTVEETFKSSRILLGYGIAANELLSTLRTLGDVAGGTGAPLERLALVFGQVRAAGRLYGQDLLQLINAGFNPLNEISQNTGKSVRELRDEMRKGNISFEEVNQAFITATSSGGRFYGLTQALSQTTAGQISKLKDEWQSLSIQIGQGLLPVFNVFVSALRKVIEGLAALPKFIEQNRKVLALLSTVSFYYVTTLFKISQLRALVTARTIIATAAERAKAVLMGITNGLQLVQNTLTSLATKEITRQAAATTLLTAAQRGLSAAIAASPIGFWVTLLAGAAAAFYAFREQVDETTDGFISSKEALAEVESLATKAVSEQTQELNKYVKAVQETVNGTKEREEAINALNKKYDVSIKNSKDEQVVLNDLNKTVQDLTSSYLKLARVEAIKEVTKNIYKQFAELQVDLQKLFSEAAGAGVRPQDIIDVQKTREEFSDVPLFFATSINQLDAIAAPVIDSINNRTTELAKNQSRLNKDNASGILLVTNEYKKQDAVVESFGAKVLSKIGLLRETVATIGSLNQQLLQATPTAPYDEDAQSKLEDAISRRKKSLEDIDDLLNRIKKNSEDIRKLDINFYPAETFEEDLERLKAIDKINEETINREIDRERKRLKEQNDNSKEILELESKRAKAVTDTEKARGEGKDVKNLENYVAELDEALKVEYEIRSNTNDALDKLEEIRGQEQLKRLKEFQKEYNAVEKKGLEERAKNIRELRSLQEEREINKFDREIKELERLRDVSIGFFDDVFNVDPKNLKDLKELRKVAKDILEGKTTSYQLAIKERTGDLTVELEKQKKREQDSAFNQYLYDISLWGKTKEERAVIYQRYSDKLTEIDNKYKDKYGEIAQEGFDAEENARQKAFDLVEKDKEKRLQAIEDLKNAVLDFSKAFADAQVAQTDAAIAAQERRVEAAEKIAEKGNAALLKLEQERLEALNREKAKYVRQQQNFAVLEVAINSAIAISKAAAEGGPAAPFTIAAALVALAAGLAQARIQAQSVASFAKGGYTGDGHQFQAAGTVHKGEFVINAQKTRQYRPLLEAIHAGRNPKALQSVQDRMLVINSKSTDQRLERIEKAIMSQKGLELSIDERGINGIVTNLQYKEQRLRNKAR